MSIFPLDQFEKDVAEQERADREIYESLQAPSSMVVRFGVMRLIGEYPYRGDAVPGCGSKMVVKTHRGTEIAEMLTSTCPNAGCSKSITRKEMLEYIDRSGGKDYPFFTDGRVLRVATVEDLQRQDEVVATRTEIVKFAQAEGDALKIGMRFVEADPILGGERLTLFYTAEERVDFRALLPVLAERFRTRLDLRQVGARDEARLVADYERCGQHCCCKQFLKVLKPVSMKNAKMQKASLDPLKISGRCGRLMCCLRYEQEGYDDLVKRLPKMRKTVGTPHGVGIVVDRQVLTQLVLVEIEGTRQRVAVAVEDLVAPEDAPKAMAKGEDPWRGARSRGSASERPGREQRQRDYAERSKRGEGGDGTPATDTDDPTTDGKKRKRRRKRKPRGSGEARRGTPDGATADPSTTQSGEGAPAKPKKKRRKRSKGRGGGGDGSGGPESTGGGPEDKGTGGGGSKGSGRGRKRRRQRFGGAGGGSGGGGDSGGSGGS